MLPALLLIEPPRLCAYASGSIINTRHNIATAPIQTIVSSEVADFEKSSSTVIGILAVCEMAHLQMRCCILKFLSCFVL